MRRQTSLRSGAILRGDVVEAAHASAPSDSVARANAARRAAARADLASLALRSCARLSSAVYPTHLRRAISDAHRLTSLLTLRTVVNVRHNSQRVNPQGSRKAYKTGW